MESIGSRDQLTVRDYLRPIWRFKFAVLLVVALATAATYLYTKREAKVYKTSTQIYIGQSALQQLLDPTTATTTATTLADQASFVTTPAVASIVRSNLKLPYSPSALLGAVSVAPASTGDFLTITAQNSNPELATRLANGFASAYLQLSRGTIASNARSALNAASRRLRHTPSGGGNVAVREALSAQIQTLEGIVVSPPSAGQQVTPAAVPGTPISPKPARDAIYAGALALVLSVILAYIFDRRRGRISSLEEIEALYDVPVLATMPRVRKVKANRKDPYAIPPALREAHRTLRVNLDIARAPVDAKVIMVTSALPSEGKSTTVRNLAISYRDAGDTVAVVEADLRRPVLAAQMGVDQGPGLSDALAADAEPRMQRVPEGGSSLDGGDGRLDVLVAGTPVDDPTVLLTSDRVPPLMEQLALHYDLVLVDSPPVLVTGDALPLLGLVDGLLIVARSGIVTQSAAARVRRTLDRLSPVERVHALGTVAIGVTDEVASYYRRPAKATRRNTLDATKERAGS